MNLNLRKLAPTEEFDYNFIKSSLSVYKNPRVKINELLKQQKIIRVKKGLYVFGAELAERPYLKETLANLIYGPSYISLEYALAFYGLIPEKVEVVTSITNKRNKDFDTPVGRFTYRFLNPSLYSFGITLHKIDNFHSVLIATKEKALADLLYFNNNFETEILLEEFLLKNLRIEKDALSNFNLQKIKTLAKLYGFKIKPFYNLIRSFK